jgi:hypothetical protein
MSIDSDQINFLIYRYLIESGKQVACPSAESDLLSASASRRAPPGFCESLGPRHVLTNPACACNGVCVCDGVCVWRVCVCDGVCDGVCVMVCDGMCVRV